MADDHIADLLLEAQQHDSIRRLNYRFELQRRDFFKILGAGLLVRGLGMPLARWNRGALVRRRLSPKPIPWLISRMLRSSHVPLVGGRGRNPAHRPRAGSWERHFRCHWDPSALAAHGAARTNLLRVDFFKMAISIRESADYRSLPHTHS